MNLQELDRLVHVGLVKKKEYPHVGLNVYKYSRKVFYDALWNESPMLEEAHGLVVDNYGLVVMRPFKKVYNYLENGAGENVDPKMVVRVVQKINGFMGQATQFAGQTLIGTTGTLDSDYAKLARKVIESAEPVECFYGRDNNTFKPANGFTYLFEICDPSDHHIIDEGEGAYLIGVRDNITGDMVSEELLDRMAQVWGFQRPEHFLCTFEEAVAMRKTCRHEGYMIQTLEGEVICKMKSHYYLVKKAMMRMGTNRAAKMFHNTAKFKEEIDEEFYSLVDAVVQFYTLEQWKGFDTATRERIFNEFYTNLVGF